MELTGGYAINNQRRSSQSEPGVGIWDGTRHRTTATLTAESGRRRTCASPPPAAAPIRWSKTKRKDTGRGQITVEGLEYQAPFKVFPPDPRFEQRADGVSIVLLKGEQLRPRQDVKPAVERSMRSVRPERPKPVVNGFIGRPNDMGGSWGLREGGEAHTAGCQQG